jgi:hypothetical protein
MKGEKRRGGKGGEEGRGIGYIYMKN